MCDANDGLMWALKNGDLDEVKEKLLTEEDVNRALKYDRTPLHFAAEFGHGDIVLFLLSKGAEMNVVDKHGFTPLTCACFEGQANCVKILLEKGANKHIKGQDGVSACEAAAQCDCQVIQALLK